MDDITRIAQSDLFRVTFRGDNSGSENYYWSHALSIAGLSNVSYDTLLFYGYEGSGVGISLLGNISVSPYYSIYHNIAKCCFLALSVGLLYGEYVQGVTVVQSNFTNGVTGISVPSGIPFGNGPAQLSISDSQFNTTANQVDLESPVSGVFVLGNLFFVPAGYCGVQFKSNAGNQAVFQGNAFVSQASEPAGTGINVPIIFFDSIVSGNMFYNLSVGLDLTAASGWNVQANVYQGVTANTINGSGNSVGVATA